MKLAGLTVCEGYADKLAKGIDRWRSGLDALMVVSSPRDTATQALCAQEREGCPVPLLLTEAFWARGAAFNKAAAMVDALSIRYADTLEAWWRQYDALLFFDADVVPPPFWRMAVDAVHPKVGTLYGARRQDEHGRLIGDGEMGGFFQLFSTADPNVQREPMLDVNWTHAGGYDSELEFRWPETRRVRIPGLVLTHLGEPGRNWCGVGNDAAMAEMMEARKRQTSIPDSERLT